VSAEVFGIQVHYDRAVNEIEQHAYAPTCAETAIEYRVDPAKRPSPYGDTVPALIARCSPGYTALKRADELVGEKRRGRAARQDVRYARG
jgi:hypothetical protein